MQPVSLELVLHPRRCLREQLGMPSWSALLRPFPREISVIMMNPRVTLTFAQDHNRYRVAAQRVTFSPVSFIRFDGSADERRMLRRLADHLLRQAGLAFLGEGPLFDALCAVRPKLRRAGLPIAAPEDLPPGTATVFIVPLDTISRLRLRRAVPAGPMVLDATLLAEIATADLPSRAWTPITRNIYPIDLPEIRFEKDLDLLLLDCPARNLALMPNGLGYVHNALKQTDIRFQTFDLDIVTYHRFHIARLFDTGGEVLLPSGRRLPTDPWQAEHYDLWQAEDVIQFFLPIIDEAASAIIAARPKMLGLSVHQCNEAVSRALVTRVREALPDICIIVGGYSCYSADIGRRVFPECDYMVIGEADLTIGPLVEALADGERPRHLPGVLARHDDPDHVFVPGPMPHNLDRIAFPRYEWLDLSVYRNFDGYQLTPIIASRGCRWSRCTFCAERFFWRIRSAEAFVDELEWLVSQGCTLFMFNESDLNGMPEKLLEICEEIIRRDIHVKLTGQLRIHKGSDAAFFRTLRRAGFVSLRFGVDAFSANGMKLQKKGYTPTIVTRNLRDCWQAGIYTEVNWVVGTPGETWDDVEEAIRFILANRQYIGRLANINPLIFVNGSVYWQDPDSYNIRFHRPRDDLYKDHYRALPADQWYSEEPFIDHHVRKAYFEHIIVRLAEADFPMGAWAQRIIADVQHARDRHRAGATQTVPVPLDNDMASAPSTPEQAEPDAERPAEPLPVPGALLRFKGDWYAIDPQSMDALPTEIKDFVRVRNDRSDGLLKGLAALWKRRIGSLFRLKTKDSAASAISAVTDGAEAELIRTIANYNIVAFDGAHYGVPHGLPIDWPTGDAETAPEILRGMDLADLLRQVFLRVQPTVPDDPSDRPEPPPQCFQPAEPAGPTLYC